MSSSPWIKKTLINISLAVAIILLCSSCNLPGELQERFFGGKEAVQPTPLPTYTPQPLPPAIVESDPPQGSTISLREGITIYFNQDMDQDSVQGALRVEPEVAGTITWLDQATMLYKPDEDLPPADGSGVITLPADTAWIFSGSVDLGGARLSCAGVAAILGTSSETAFLTSTGLTGSPLITSASTLRMQNLAIHDVETAFSIGGSADIALDWDAVAERLAEIDRDECLVSGFVEMGLFERSYLLLGMDTALMAYVTEPDLVAELVGAVADYKIELIERFDDVANLDLVWYGDDWGTQDRLFMRPEAWRAIIKPHTQRIYDCMKRRGILINQHSCGRIEAIFGDVVEMGADIWNPCQPCNDLARLKGRYGGQIAFCGGIDSQFVLNRPGATPDEVRAEVRKRIDEMASGGGYIAAPSHSVPYDPALIEAMDNEIAVYGRLFYTGCAR